MKLSQVSVQFYSGFCEFHEEQNVLNNSLEQVISPVSKKSFVDYFLGTSQKRSS